jgi:hypothetical protein
VQSCSMRAQQLIDMSLANPSHAASNVVDKEYQGLWRPYLHGPGLSVVLASTSNFSADRKRQVRKIRCCRSEEVPHER